VKETEGGRTRFGKLVCRLHPWMSRGAGEANSELPQLAHIFAPAVSAGGGTAASYPSRASSSTSSVSSRVAGVHTYTRLRYMRVEGRYGKGLGRRAYAGRRLRKRESDELSRSVAESKVLNSH